MDDQTANNLGFWTRAGCLGLPLVALGIILGAVVLSAGLGLFDFGPWANWDEGALMALRPDPGGEAVPPTVPTPTVDPETPTPEVVAPTPTPTVAPVPVAPTAAIETDCGEPVPGSATETCWMEELTGVFLVRVGTESGAWTLNSKSAAAVDYTCPAVADEVFVCTLDLASPWEHAEEVGLVDPVVFVLGDNITHQVVAATVRRLNNYEEETADDVFGGELVFSRQEEYEFADGRPYQGTVNP